MTRLGIAVSGICSNMQFGDLKLRTTGYEVQWFSEANLAHLSANVASIEEKNLAIISKGTEKLSEGFI